MRRLIASFGLVLAALAGASCRQATGLDQFVVQCAAGEPGCPDSGAPEDCVTGLDTNGDGVLPAECTGDVAWTRVTAGTVTIQCPNEDGFGTYEIAAARRLGAMASFGRWSAATGSVSGSVSTCAASCAFDAHGLDAEGEALAFHPQLSCYPGSALVGLARGGEHAYAGAAVEAGESRVVHVSAHRLEDASFAWRWEWVPPAAVTSLALAADTSALVAVGQTGRILFAEPDDDHPAARFHELPGASSSSMALTRAAGSRTLLLAGQTVAPADDPGPCGLGATSPTAFVARVPLGQGSADPAAPAPLACAGFPLVLDIGTDTKSPSMRVAARPDGHACWAYLGTDTATNRRRLRVGCFDLEPASAGWQQVAELGDDLAQGVDITVDPFGHVLVTAALSRVTQLSLWGAVTVPLAAADTPNVLVLKLHRDTGAVIWARMFAVPGTGTLLDPHVAADDDGFARLGFVADAKPLAGGGPPGPGGSSGLATHFVGLHP